MALDSVEKWQRSLDFAESPLVELLTDAAIDVEPQNNDPNNENSKYLIDLIVKAPYEMLLEVKLEETTQKNADHMVGMLSDNCIRYDQQDISRYNSEQAINQLPVWIAARTQGEYSEGWYFIPLIIFNQLKHGGIHGSILVYPGESKNVFYCVDKRRCLTLQDFINYIHGTDGQRRIIDNQIHADFCNPNYF